ncbi:MAG: 3-methylornithine--L-lysine ligase PylC [Bacillota bacterium]|nr:3-methylornithine--L-lysine ligase PylC [Bacillota bacterium]
MRAAVIGGRLQGLEAVYLARKAGWDIVLVDIKSSVPAQNMADTFYLTDARRKDELAAVLSGSDIIIPALENRAVLANLIDTAEVLDIPLALDLNAYDLSSSKIASDQLFEDIGVAYPKHWPGCCYPLIAKPTGASGSEGVIRLQDESDLELFRKKIGDEEDRWVLQEYLTGPSYSIEIIGYKGEYLPLQVTGLEMDDIYDCKRVLAPADLSEELKDHFSALATNIAEEINLNGIMDVEVILNKGVLKVLEIDARLPSQTPTAVFHSTGINMLETLTATFINGRLNKDVIVEDKKAVIFEHIFVSPGKITVSGEHVVSEAGPLALLEDFFGADEALTNYAPGMEKWMATLIITGSDSTDVRNKRESVIKRLMTEMDLIDYLDPEPRVQDIKS